MTQQIPCQTCGVLFEPRKSGGKPQVRCSMKCRRKVSNANFIKKNAPLRKPLCAECGSPIDHADLGRPRRFCSDKCKMRAANRAQNRRRLPAPKQAERECAHCGKPFMPRLRGQIYCPAGPGTYCAQKAYKARVAAGEPLRQVEQTKTCAECGRDFTAYSPKAKFCSKICRIRLNGRDASRRRSSTTGSVLYTDREIFERDGWICQICQQPINREVSRLHPDGATIDHVVPLSLFGLDAPDNVVAAHWRCNREKGNRVSPPALAADLVERYPDLVAAALTARRDGGSDG